MAGGDQFKSAHLLSPLYALLCKRGHSQRAPYSTRLVIVLISAVLTVPRTVLAVLVLILVVLILTALILAVVFAVRIGGIVVRVLVIVVMIVHHSPLILPQARR